MTDKKFYVQYSDQNRSAFTTKWHANNLRACFGGKVKRGVVWTWREEGVQALLWAAAISFVIGFLASCIKWSK